MWVVHYYTPDVWRVEAACLCYRLHQGVHSPHLTSPLLLLIVAHALPLLLLLLILAHALPPLLLPAPLPLPLPCPASGPCRPLVTPAPLPL